jgi:hypothetical protein
VLFRAGHPGGVGEGIDQTLFRDVPIADLPSVAENLRHVPPPRMGWGHRRAIAHDFVYEILCAATV